ncbi:hypothetical protein SmJEL517_g04643 [Synchytrium microbalum]|uniref:Uncharacterized protein n=1 Tax=Synchytrium microbalum TaxID=1806994 RepID=A0A507BR50_9FUNG|nr:uncharacterized protein SmJEL517_g04643 [Synchytrium microbalum]TPX32200.1 hypothetical protein SmJEL517_g04643 [Synchytrium microbalum]
MALDNRRQDLSSANLISDAPDEIDIRVNTVLYLLVFANLWTILMTIIPVFANDIPLYDASHPGWYTSNDVVRIIEPIGTLPFQFFILLESRIFEVGSRTEIVLVSLCFTVSAAIYQQGAGFHSAANMFKHVFEDALAIPSTSGALTVLLNDGYVYTRTTWEHYVGHYLYAIGGILVSFTHAYAYRNVKIKAGLTTPSQKVLLCLAIIIYGLIIGSVAVEFPKGVIVALVLIIVYGFGVLGTVLVRSKSVFSWGTRIMLQYFFYAYCISLVIVIGWMIHVRGIADRVESTGGVS